MYVYIYLSIYLHIYTDKQIIDRKITKTDEGKYGELKRLIN